MCAMSPRLLVPRATGFDPRRLGGLVVWLDSSDRSSLFDATTGGSVVADNGAVARWADKSGNANHAIQSALADRPLVRAASVAGKSSLEFDGLSDFMRIAGNSTLDVNTFTAFCVVRLATYIVSASRAIALLSKGDYTTAAGTAYELTTSGSPARWAVGLSSGGTFSSSGTGGSSSATQQAWTLVAGRRPSASAATVFANKTASGTTSVISGTLNNVAADLGIGARGTGTPVAGVDLFPGNFAEILFFNVALSDAQMTAVNNYLYGKWAL